MIRRLAFALALTLVNVTGCTRQPDDDPIRAEVQALTLLRGESAIKAAERLARHGRRAIPSIESALHTGDEPARKNLIVALRRIGDGDAVPLLAHLATWDADEGVRKEALWTLRGWAAESDARAARAREALRQLDEQKAREGSG